MIGELPVSVSINGRDVPLKNTDFRGILIILQAYNDPELSDKEKAFICLDALIGIENIQKSEYQDAIKACIWFIDGGGQYDNNKAPRPRVMDWEQDEQLIFSAVNHVAGMETRTTKYLHWWTFLSYFNEITEGTFAYIVGIRQKKANGKKLDKTEMEYLQKNKDIVVLKTKLTDEEQREKDELNARFK